MTRNLCIREEKPTQIRKKRKSTKIFQICNLYVCCVKDNASSPKENEIEKLWPKQYFASSAKHWTTHFFMTSDHCVTSVISSFQSKIIQSCVNHDISGLSLYVSLVSQSFCGYEESENVASICNSLFIQRSTYTHRETHMPRPTTQIEIK